LTTKNAPDAVAPAIEGNEIRPTQKDTDSVITVPSIPSSADVLAEVEPGWGEITVVMESVIGTDMEAGKVLARLERYDEILGDGTPLTDRWTVNFLQVGPNHAEVAAADIPVLIDKLTEMHRAWLHLDPACTA